MSSNAGAGDGDFMIPQKQTEVTLEKTVVRTEVKHEPLEMQYQAEKAPLHAPPDTEPPHFERDKPKVSCFNGNIKDYLYILSWILVHFKYEMQNPPRVFPKCLEIWVKR